MTLPDIKDWLFALRDLPYRDFQSALMPSVPKDSVIGVRMPALRKLANEIVKQGQAQAFMAALPHSYYEENCLHGLLLALETDPDACARKLEAFLPYVDNWAVCDLLRIPALAEQPEKLLDFIKLWLVSGHPYTVRFGIKMLMDHFLEKNFKEEYLSWMACNRSDEYYVRMMIAWYFATALALHYETVLPVLTENRLETWIHNKTIQKATESLRISTEQKEYLKTLKRK